MNEPEQGGNGGDPGDSAAGQGAPEPASRNVRERGDAASAGGSSGDGKRRDEPRHPIRVVSTRTGLTPSALRAWERRYGVVEPARSEGGQRLYTDADIERLALLKRVTDAGRSIGDVSELPPEEVRRLAREDEEARQAVARLERDAAPAAVEATASEIRERAMESVEALDAETLESVLRRGVATLGGLAFMEDVVAPLLEEVGDRWAAGELRPAHEHVASAVIRRVLAWLADAAGTDEGPAIVVGVLPGEGHAIGATLAATTAALEGWAATDLGGHLPVEEIATAAEGVGARVVGLSVASSSEVERTAETLTDLRRRLPPEVALLVGGRRAGEVVPKLADPGIRLMRSLVEFRDALREIGNGDGGDGGG